MSAVALGKVEEWVEELESPRSTIILDRVSTDTVTSSCTSEMDTYRSSHSGAMQRQGSSLLKRMVSKNHRRFVNGEFNLDLSYITERIISMSCPATTATMKIYRNSMGELAKFLDLYHAGRYKVYNLCSELVYDVDLLGGNVVRYPCDDQQPPPLEVLYNFCEDAVEWLNQHPENIIVVHCQAGKGRTGVMVCGLLLFMNKCKNAQEAMDLFAQMRTKNGKGVTISSQQRYVQYFWLLYRNMVPYHTQGVQISQVNLIKMGNFLKLSGQQDLYLAISSRNSATEMQTAPIVLVQLPRYQQLSETPQMDQNGIQVFLSNDTVTIALDLMEVPLVCTGDVKVQVFKGIPSKKHSLFYLWFNAGIEGVEEQTLCYDTKDLDKVSSWAKKNKLAVEIQTQPAQDRFSPCGFSGYSSRDDSDSVHIPTLDHQSRHSSFGQQSQFSSFDTSGGRPSSDSFHSKLGSFDHSQSKHSMSFKSSTSSMSLKLLSDEAMAMNPYMFGRTGSSISKSKGNKSARKYNRHEYAQLRELSYSRQNSQNVDDILSILESKWFAQ